MEENKIKVYLQIDGNNIITRIESSISNIDFTTGWTLVDEGIGDKYAHAQVNYLEDGLIDSNGKYNYKLADGKIVELTDEEKENLFPTQTTTTLTNSERISALEDALLMML